MGVLSKLALVGSVAGFAIESKQKVVSTTTTNQSLTSTSQSAMVKYSNKHFGKKDAIHRRATIRKAFSKSKGFLGYTVKTGSKGMNAMESFYHTSDQISDRLKELAGDCDGLTIDTKAGMEGAYDVSIDVATLNRNPSQEKKNKFFILFGEHARELISPESSLHFLESLCGKHDDEMNAQKIASVLEHSEFQIIVNGNPNSRRKVEEGDFCLRVNGQGVDLNRNWDEKWEPADQSDSATV